MEDSSESRQKKDLGLAPRKKTLPAGERLFAPRRKTSFLARRKTTTLPPHGRLCFALKRKTLFWGEKWNSLLKKKGKRRGKGGTIGGIRRWEGKEVNNIIFTLTPFFHTLCIRFDCFSLFINTVFLKCLCIRLFLTALRPVWTAFGGSIGSLRSAEAFKTK